MGFTQVSRDFAVQTFDTSELVQLGRYKVAEATELYHAVMGFYKEGTLGGSETLQLKLYGTAAYAGTPVASSAVVTVASLATTTKWIGSVRFDFSTRPNLNPALWYYAAVATTGYTRNANTFYMGATLDWPFSVNTINGGGPAARLSFAGYR